jgi:capsular polysaccharide biosynthesis protein
VEIIDYLSSLGRRCWVLILLPLLAGVAFAGVAFHLGHKNVVNAQIDAPTLIGVRGAESDGNQYSIELQNTLQVELSKKAILDEISRESGVSVAKLKAGLSVGRKKPSSFAVISFTGASAKKSKAVATAAADVAYGAVLATEQQATTGPLTQAQQSLAAAQSAVANQASNTPDPLTSYIVDRIEVSRLEAVLARHLSNGNLGAALSDEAALAQARNQQAALVNAVGTEGQLIDQRDQARTTQAARYREYLKAENKLMASSPGNAVHVGTPKKSIPLKEMVLIGGSAGGATLALLLLWQWITEARRWLRLRGTAPALAA